MLVALLFGFLSVSAIALRLFVADAFSADPLLAALLANGVRPASV
ncbi:MAG: hypothetical protein NVS3B2_00120 [Ramlibacter sp.]